MVMPLTPAISTSHHAAPMHKNQNQTPSNLTYTCGSTQHAIFCPRTYLSDTPPGAMREHLELRQQAANLWDETQAAARRCWHSASPRTECEALSHHLLCCLCPLSQSEDRLPSLPSLPPSTWPLPPPLPPPDLYLEVVPDAARRTEDRGNGEWLSAARIAIHGTSRGQSGQLRLLHRLYNHLLQVVIPCAKLNNSQAHILVCHEFLHSQSFAIPRKLCVRECV